MGKKTGDVCSRTVAFFGVHESRHLAIAGANNRDGGVYERTSCRWKLT